MGSLDAVNAVLGDELDIGDHQFTLDTMGQDSPDLHSWI